MARTPNRTRYAILGMLAEQSLSGYGIKKIIEETIDHFWQESHGQLYPILHQLAQEGKIIGEEIKTGKRSSTIYKITDKGKQELKNWLKKPVFSAPQRSELTLKLFFGGNTEVATNLEHVKRQQLKMQQRIAQFIALEAELKQQYPNDPNLPYWLITLRNGYLVSKGWLQWCEETIKVLTELENKR